MHTRLVPILLAAGFVAAPALAQTGSQPGQTTGHGTTAGATDPAQIERQIAQDLTKAGYTDVHVIPGSFLVQAKDSQGNTTQMMITPGGITAVTAPDRGGANQATPGTGGNNRE